MFLVSMCLVIFGVSPGQSRFDSGRVFFEQIYLFFYYVPRSAITRETLPTGQFGRYNRTLRTSDFVDLSISSWFVQLDQLFFCKEAAQPNGAHRNGPHF